MPAEPLRAPYHWHIDMVVFEHERDGQYMEAVHVHDIVSNDVPLAESWAVDQVGPVNGPRRLNRRVEEIRFCSQEAHLGVALPRALLRKVA